MALFGGDPWVENRAQGMDKTISTTMEPGLPEPGIQQVRLLFALRLILST